ncbi:zonular occludens toxin domain-containing protein [Neptunomonas antarctica]|uniref:Zonular occludens toxin (Zot) n=1 Tax=Neptunomonas antarctica TaxID=619304 RepID=A0A1N7J5K7_9GAMM|nr:zonular occludens toxin domain-containing protein [Neptunomonas antarctica]SIS44668.1 Zonular occludens toxin (Zot) [Neptunomonas antarctica]
MFFLFTGQPGSKKTANMIHFVMTDPQFKNRPVYFYNITECIVPGWEELTKEQVLNWPNELPEGAVLLIDEAQEIWRPAAWDKTPPEHVTGLEKHRHRGLDILATTQHPMLIHTAVRRQVQQHRHISAAYGLRSKAMIWEKCVNDPDEHFTKQDAASESANVPKSVFQLYKSTALNTHKVRVPKKLYFVGFIVAAVLIGGINFVYDMSTRANDKQSVAGGLSGVVSTMAGGITQAAPSQNKSYAPIYPVDPIKYLSMYKPRIEGLPATAPIYDELQKPVVAPRVLCVRIHLKEGASCKCLTQQATRVNVPLGRCDSLIDDGMFDNTRTQTVSYDRRGDSDNKITQGQRSDL